MTRPYTEADRPAVLALALRAWAPVFASLHADDDLGEIHMLAVDLDA